MPHKPIITSADFLKEHVVITSVPGGLLKNPSWYRYSAKNTAAVCSWSHEKLRHDTHISLVTPLHTWQRALRINEVDLTQGWQVCKSQDKAFLASWSWGHRKRHSFDAYSHPTPQLWKEHRRQAWGWGSCSEHHASHIDVDSGRETQIPSSASCSLQHSGKSYEPPGLLNIRAFISLAPFISHVPHFCSGIPLLLGPGINLRIQESIWFYKDQQRPITAANLVCQFQVAWTSTRTICRSQQLQSHTGFWDWTERCFPLDPAASFWHVFIIPVPPVLTPPPLPLPTQGQVEWRAGSWPWAGLFTWFIVCTRIFQVPITQSQENWQSLSQEDEILRKNAIPKAGRGMKRTFHFQF